MTYDLLTTPPRAGHLGSHVDALARLCMHLVNDLRLRQAVLLCLFPGQLSKQHGLAGDVALGHIVTFNVPEGYLVRHGIPPQCVHGWLLSTSL